MDQRIIKKLSGAGIDTRKVPLDLFFSDIRAVNKGSDQTQPGNDETKGPLVYVKKYRQSNALVQISHRVVSKIIDDSKLLNRI